MFEIDTKGLAELEGGRPAYRLALEPVSNVFDEYRGYGDGTRRKPSYCAVTLERSQNPRGVWLTVVDDGPGFSNEKDIYTLYGSTPKRSCTSVGGRFNIGEKQLIASAVESKVVTWIDGVRTEVSFHDGKRHTHRTKYLEPSESGTTVQSLMRWTAADLQTVREQLLRIIPPDGLLYSIDGNKIEQPRPIYCATVTLPTVKLDEGLLRATTGKTQVNVHPPLKLMEPWLYELGVPVCNIAEIGFPYSLDVQQKIPVPSSRDMVETSYLYKLIGLVLEQAALDGKKLLTEEDQKSGFVKDALDYVSQPEALDVIVKSLYGEDVVRQSNDPIANAKAAAAGSIVIPGRWFGQKTRDRLEVNNIMPTSYEKFGGSEKPPQGPGSENKQVCPTCGGKGTIACQ
jgi:hypothetical protein